MATDDTTATSASLSLLELRRYLLRRAAALQARARDLKEKGNNLTAARMIGESERLRNAAQTMRQSNDSPKG